MQLDITRNVHTSHLAHSSISPDSLSLSYLPSRICCWLVRLSSSKQVAHHQISSKPLFPRQQGSRAGNLLAFNAQTVSCHRTGFYCCLAGFNRIAPLVALIVPSIFLTVLVTSAVSSTLLFHLLLWRIVVLRCRLACCQLVLIIFNLLHCWQSQVMLATHCVNGSHLHPFLMCPHPQLILLVWRSGLQHRE